MDVVPAHVEAVLAKVVVLTLEAAVPLAANGLLLHRALVAIILLGERFVELEAVRLSDLIAEGHCFGGGKRQHFNGLLPRIVGPRHTNSNFPEIAVVI